MGSESHVLVILYFGTKIQSPAAGMGGDILLTDKNPLWGKNYASKYPNYVTRREVDETVSKKL